MLTQFSNYLFLGSSALLIVTLVYQGFGRKGTVKFINTENPSGSYTDLQLIHDHTQTLQSQNSFLRMILSSYLVWLSIAGIAAAVVLTLI